MRKIVENYQKLGLKNSLNWIKNFGNGSKIKEKSSKMDKNYEKMLKIG